MRAQGARAPGSFARIRVSTWLLHWCQISWDTSKKMGFPRYGNKKIELFLSKFCGLKLQLKFNCSRYKLSCTVTEGDRTSPGADRTVGLGQGLNKGFEVELSFKIYFFGVPLESNTQNQVQTVKKSVVENMS